jgi:hypothetical protein
MVTNPAEGIEAAPIEARVAVKLNEWIRVKEKGVPDC